MTGHPAASADVLVIGAGPAGLVASRAAAVAGRRCVVVDADTAGRSSRANALLTPAALASLDRLGLAHVADGHRVAHVRVSAGEDSTSTSWPTHPGHPRHGTVVERRRFDDALADAAVADGVEIWFGHEAIAPVVERGFVRGAHLATGDDRFEARAEYVVVADGANSRFGRALGSFRRSAWPLALAHHAEFGSAISDATEIEIVVGLRDRAGTPITGYGWMFPTGRGTVDVGVLLVSTSPSFQVLNPVHVLDRFVAEHGDRWHLSAAATAPGTGGRIPLACSVRPAAGPTWLLVGDALGAADPWTGAGLGPAIDSGAIAGDVLTEALASGSADSLQRYPGLLHDRFEPAYGVGRLADRILGQPSLSARMSTLAARHHAMTDSFLRLSTGAVRPGHLGPAELAFRIARGLGVVLPGV